MKKFNSLLTVGALLITANCATIIDGTDQKITVNSNPSGANCDLLRNGNKLLSVTTPDIAVIEKTKNDIKITCNKAGYKTTSVIDKSGTDKWVFGNVLLLSPVLAIADSAAGSDNKYDSPVTVTLDK